VSIFDEEVNPYGEEANPYTTPAGPVIYTAPELIGEPSRQPYGEFKQQVMRGAPLQPNAITPALPAPAAQEASALERSRQALGEEQAAIGQEQEAIGQRKTSEGTFGAQQTEAFDRLATAYGRNAADMQGFLARRQEAEGAKLKEIQNLPPLNPNRLWESKSIGAKLGLMISMAFSGIGNAFMGKGDRPNQVAEMLSGAAKEDMEAQVNEQGRKRQEYQDLRQQFGDEFAAKQFMHAQRIDGIRLELDKAKASYTSAMGKAVLDQASAQLGAQSAQLKQSAAQREIAQSEARQARIDQQRHLGVQESIEWSRLAREKERDELLKNQTDAAALAAQEEALRRGDLDLVKRAQAKNQALNERGVWTPKGWLKRKDGDYYIPSEKEAESLHKVRDATVNAVRDFDMLREMRSAFGSDNQVLSAIMGKNTTELGRKMNAVTADLIQALHESGGINRFSNEIAELSREKITGGVDITSARAVMGVLNQGRQMAIDHLNDKLPGAERFDIEDPMAHLPSAQSSKEMLKAITERKDFAPHELVSIEGYLNDLGSLYREYKEMPTLSVFERARAVTADTDLDYPEAQLKSILLYSPNLALRNAAGQLLTGSRNIKLPINFAESSKSVPPEIRHIQELSSSYMAGDPNAIRTLNQIKATGSLAEQQAADEVLRLGAESAETSLANQPPIVTPGMLRPSGRTKKFAKGGIVKGPQHALIGEDGPEAVVPLSPERSDDRERVIRQALKLMGVDTMATGGIVDPGKDQPSDPDPGGSPLDAKHSVLAQVADDFPPHATEWIRNIPWDGPVRVPLSSVDYSNKEHWKAWGDDEKIEKFKKKIRQGWHKEVILVDRPGARTMMVVDGHHRALAYRDLNKPIVAYVGHAPALKGAWDEFHSSQNQDTE